MGTSLSQQEQLFVELRWQELLENAMEADVAEQEQHASGATADRKKSQQGFRVSFNELQGFLSVLEYVPPSLPPTSSTETHAPAVGMSAAFSQVCARLTTDQLHSPIIVLMVHVCSWWAGAIDDTTLTDRMDELCALIVKQVGTSASPSGTDSQEAQRDDVLDRHSSRQSHTRGLDLLIEHFGGDKAVRAGVTDERAMAKQQMDSMIALATLFYDLLAERAVGAEEHAPSAAARRARQTRRTHFDELADVAARSPRPMVNVALCFLLAVFADRTSEAILYAEDGVAQLRQLSTIFTAHRAERDRTRADKGPRTGGDVLWAPVQWGLVRLLEESLARHQYELDAAQAVSETGTAMNEAMRGMRVSRLKLAHTSLSAMSATERWRSGMAQYVGQRHAWDVLRQHFLSADLFDLEKPTVIVLFGPSGYGKSEMGKRLASVLHACAVNDVEASGKLVHIHMPSFCTKDSIYSLVDPPAAHVGDGILLSALLKADDAVVVLDEFEKSTADAIQNLWLSAFQKHGTLRSLKKADRCVSTVRTTFVLTCNTSADYIDAHAQQYLSADAEARQALRNDFVNDCRQTFRQSLGDPFINRVDYFLPFVPYTREERTQFVEMQLERLLSQQRERGRTIHVTPRFVKALVDELKTFHASTIEEIVRPLVVRMAQCGYEAAVLTVVARAATTSEARAGGGSATSRPGFSGLSFVVMPAHQQPPSRETAADTGYESNTVDSAIPQCAWQDVKGGAAALALWGREEDARPDIPPPAAASGAPAITVAPTPGQSGGEKATGSASTEAACAVPSVDSALEVELELHKEAEKSLNAETEREKVLMREVEKLRQVIVEKDKQIATLKEKVLMLQKALAVMMCMVLCCCVVMAMVIGLKLTLILLGAMLILLCVVLGVPLRILLGAVWALFQFLGPAKSAIIIALMAMWVYRAGASLVLQCK